MTHIWSCTCGAETPCRPEDTRYGAVFECPGCRRVFACVYPKGGGKAWVDVSPQDVAFHHLLRRPEDANE